MIWLLLLSNVAIIALGVWIVVQRVRLNRKLGELRHDLERHRIQRAVLVDGLKQTLREVEIRDTGRRTAQRSSVKGIL